MLIPLRGKLLIKILSEVKKTESGLYLADTIKEVPYRGVVEALGKPYMDEKGKITPWDVKEGETVYFKRNWTGQDNTHYILPKDDIYAVERNLNIEAVNEQVIVKRVYTGKIGQSTIVIPESYGVKQNYEDFYGEVVSSHLRWVKVGDKLIYHRNEGLPVRYKGYEYFSLKPRAVLAKIA